MSKKSSGSPGAPPRSWLLESIIVSLFFFFPIGIPAVIVALRSRSKWKRGDVRGAESDTRLARRLVLWAFWCGVACGVIALIASSAVGKFHLQHL